MSSPNSFQHKINEVRLSKKTNIVLALDPKFQTPDLLEYLNRHISELSRYLCGIKLNFHVILPLSESELKEIVRIAHDNQVPVIADLKINDIYDTNAVIVQRLADIGFDCAIVNPFIGRASLISLVKFAHSINFGIISLVYMSHPDAVEGYGASILSTKSTNEVGKLRKVYRVFYENSLEAQVDGIVVGGNRIDILRELSSEGKPKIPIYSPGLITQGGNIDLALEAGTTYLIIGRAIIDSQNPLSVLKEILNSVSCMMQ
ncbi:orotidine 5'-phosphate decarboxylase / HUMPS family protein [Candidatus Nitrosocosmicus agrestis]|jgi:orotidine-5'-phosphate decarboxylase|uniref:orotidine 5'-phosphate decarboxylase / HUMPS family protein n=1 Tax=Candidatus Nitrosocosmicus agrestis TaxID=2563600 RepID=UPI00122E3A1A|nr:orotidine 5'-phosphate decarboxylase / HUMPS family protein [Candidatus Nitrosocosmicus sp. SS]KAA2280807.1 orotidine 5'-phosphate decarboxylase [Candidatus Nitrosocosmicus sp. SS]KAF0868892.1 orotidine 5'-phosphate decarboxylase [Candidatus Nitrosocosmicus sp. SS]MDR4492133.1 orotidine 5'-phosphate decarboxylase [Candidatus Nitrosocosmicus sp.]